MPRGEKQDPKLKAQAALDAANKKIARLEKAAATAAATLSAARLQIQQAKVDRDYAAAHPLLQPTPSFAAESADVASPQA
jgi:multidrug resistance efflux pump